MEKKELESSLSPTLTSTAGCHPCSPPVMLWAGWGGLKEEECEEGKRDEGKEGDNT